MTELSLTKRVRAGVGWSAAHVALREAMTLGRTIVIARLLAPDDLGLFGMAATVMGALKVLTNMGLYGSLIANEFSSDEEVARHLDTIWTAELVRRLILTLLLWAAVYPTVYFYQDARLYEILPVISLVPLISAFNSKGLILLRKKVRFAKIVSYELMTDVVSTVAAIGFAVWTRNVWALVLSQVVSAVINVLLSYRFIPHRPRFAFDKEAFKLAFNFGKYMFVIALMTYLTTTADNVVVGRLYGPGVLGAYVVAYGFASLPASVLYHVLSGVMFPAYAELKAKKSERLEKAFTKSFALTATLLTIITVPLFLLADEIVRFLFGRKWDAAGPVLQVLALLGFFRGLAHTIAPLVLGLNRPDREAKTKTIEAILFLALLYPLTAGYGTNGAAWAGVVVYFVTFLNRFWFVRALFPEGFKKCSRVLAAASFAGVAGAFAGRTAINFVEADVARLVVGSLVSMGVVGVVMVCLQDDLRRELTLKRAIKWRALVPAKKEAHGG